MSLGTIFTNILDPVKGCGGILVVVLEGAEDSLASFLNGLGEFDARVRVFGSRCGVKESWLLVTRAIAEWFDKRLLYVR